MPMIAAASALYMAASTPHMNAGLQYLIANAAPGHEHSPRGFQATSSFFEVMSPPITSRYAGVVWRVLDPVPLPADVVTKYNGTTMAVTGFEVDVVRLAHDGSVSSVPNFQSCEHARGGAVRVLSLSALAPSSGAVRRPAHPRVSR